MKRLEIFINSINVFDYERFRDRVVKACNISSAAWSFWRNSKWDPERKYQAQIDQIALEMFGRTVYEEAARKEDHDPYPEE